MNDDITPRVSSGTLERWPMWAEWARAASGKLARIGKHSRAADADKLAQTFDGWAGSDPGQAVRAKAIQLLFQLREEAGFE